MSDARHYVGLNPFHFIFCDMFIFVGSIFIGAHENSPALFMGLLLFGLSVVMLVDGICLVIRVTTPQAQGVKEDDGDERGDKTSGMA